MNLCICLGEYAAVSSVEAVAYSLRIVASYAVEEKNLIIRHSDGFRSRHCPK